jgi:hypothetical protein
MTTMQIIIYCLVAFFAAISIEDWAKKKTPAALGHMSFYFLMIIGTIVDAILSKV